MPGAPSNRVPSVLEDVVVHQRSDQRSPTFVTQRFNCRDERPDPLVWLPRTVRARSRRASRQSLGGKADESTVGAGLEAIDAEDVAVAVPPQVPSEAAALAARLAEHVRQAGLGEQ